MAYHSFHGCFFLNQDTSAWSPQSRHYLPQVELKAHTTIQSTASRTRLQQTFINNTASSTPEVQYTFPLYDGVSVVSFKCTIGDKVIFGIVKEKNEARTEYKQAVARGEAAGLLEQMHEASDVFTTKIGNIPQNGTAIIEIEYIGELKHDAQLDGVRFSIPTTVAPRYGGLSTDSQTFNASRGSGIEIVVDVEVDENAHIEGLSSPSHPIAMGLGRTSTQKDEFKSNRASATLSLGTTELGQDFVIVVNAQEQGVPRALLEEHPDFPNHRALMTTLVPKFNLPNIHPEIVFVVDRSGSMAGKMSMVIEALKVFLKSLPLSAKFNICSFGSSYTFMFPKSVAYDEKTLQHALRDIDTFNANYGGTELLAPIQEAVKKRLDGVSLEIMVLTDGEIWNQQETFDFINNAAMNNMRLFSLGVGAGVSTSLVEGIARAGNGFAQFVLDNEKIDKRVVRMLKAALSPHINDYHLEVKYSEEDPSSDDDFEMVEPNNAKANNIVVPKVEKNPPKPISLFDTGFQESSTNPPAGRYDHLPTISPPKELQAPHHIAGLFPFNRVCTYLLLPNCKRGIKSVLLRGTYNNGPIELEIPIRNIGQGKTVHQLAAKKAMLDIEEGRGWLSTASTSEGVSFKTKYNADWERIVEREAVRIGVTFQIAGKFCSFVAVESHPGKQNKTLGIPEPQQNPPPYSSNSATRFGGSVQSRVMRTSPFDEKKKKGGGGLRKMRASSGSNSTPVFGNSQPNASFSAYVAPPSGALATNYSNSARGGPPGTGSSLFSPQPLFSETRSQYSVAQPQSGGTQSLFGSRPPPPAPAAAPAREESVRHYSLAPTSKEFNLDFSTLENSDVLDNFEFDSFLRNTNDPSFDLSGTETRNSNQWREDRRHDRNVPNTVEAKVHKIIDLQRFDGSWTAVDELFKLIEVWKGDFVDASMKYEDETVNAIILTIAWLEKEASNYKETWEMVVDKAKQWLTTTHGITDADDAIKQAIMIFFP